MSWAVLQGSLLFSGICRVCLRDAVGAGSRDESGALRLPQLRGPTAASLWLKKMLKLKFSLFLSFPFITRMERSVEQGGIFFSLPFGLKYCTFNPLCFVLFQKKCEEEFDASAIRKL